MAGVRFRIGGIMNSISIDIETFSSNDLSKCGVYKYVEAPDFDILLFGYAVDGGEVVVVDLAAGEEIPAEILSALADENITKWAFNSSPDLVSITEISKDYGWSAQKMNEYLHRQGIQFKQGGRIWILYQKYAYMPGMADVRSSSR